MSDGLGGGTRSARSALLSVAQMAEADRAAIAAGTPGLTLMERAGAAVADAITERFTPCRTLVLAGPGNNGGDAYVVARLLKARGFAVRLEASAPPRTDDAKAAAEAWGEDVHPLRGTFGDAELVVVGLFGAGLDRPLTGEALRLARLSERNPERVVAIDLPSGLSGDSGQPVGEAAFHAGLTVTFGQGNFASHSSGPFSNRLVRVWPSPMSATTTSPQ